MSIRSELESRLAAWAAIQVPPIPISFEGVPFNKPISGTWLQAFMITSNTLNPTVDAKRQRNVGVFQVNCWGKDGHGSKETEDLANSIIELYPILPKVGTVSIERTPNSSPAFTDTDWRVVPVRIQYRQEI